MAEDNNSGHGKQIKVIVNGRDKVINKEELTFVEVVALAFDNPSPETMFTVSYRNADQRPESGTLVAGQKVKVKDGTIFNVTATNKS